MRVILAGQKSFGRAAYDMLEQEGHEIVGVWSPTTKAPGPRSTIIRPEDQHGEDKLTRKAEVDGKWWWPSERVPEYVDRMGVDLFVCAHSHDFISRAAREATKLGGIGYHPSLLPRHRGRDAIRWAVHMGDPITGGTVYWLSDNIDGGPVAAQDWRFIEPGVPPDEVDAVASRLWRHELFPMGIALLRQVLRDVENRVLVEVPQDELYATFEPSWERPPLHRPDLPQIGTGPPGYTVVTR